MFYLGMVSGRFLIGFISDYVGDKNMIRIGQLIAAAGIGVAKIALLRLDLFHKTGAFMDLLNWKLVLLAAVIYITLVKFRKHPVLYIAAAAAVGIIFRL